MGNFESVDFWKNTDEEVKTLQNESKKLLRDKKIYRKFLEKQHNRVSSIENLLGKYPSKNEQIRIITQKSFNSYAILLYIIEHENIEDCYLTTYNMDMKTIEGLSILVESLNINNLTILISESINFRMPKRAEQLKKIASDKIKIIFCWNHTKIILAKTVTGKHFVVEGSGNLSDNARIEQYLFEESKDTYNFHKDWINGIKKITKNELKIYGGDEK